MSRFRFHIGGLLILVVFLGIGFAALREASELWDSIVLSAASGVLLVSVLLTIHRKAEKRAFWAGFTLFGWGYVALTLLPPVEPRLLTTKALAYLDSKVPGRPVVITGQAWGGSAPNPGPQGYIAFSPQANLVADTTNSGSVWLYNMSTGKLLWSAGGTTEHFIRIGHSLCALIVAWLGGRLSRRLHVRSRDVPPEPGRP
jgi:hypothetical protein